MWCWGANNTGQLGNGSTTLAAAPVQVFGIDGVQDVAIGLAVGGDHACAMLDSGRTVCWGDDQHGQLADGDVDEPLFFEDYETRPIETVPVEGGIARIYSGDTSTCAVSNSGTLLCTSRQSATHIFYPMAAVENTVAISVGGGAGCALSGSGTLRCWGDDDLGQVGNGDEGLDGASDGSVFSPDLVDASAWGSSRVLAVSAGGRFACALTADAHVWCWGSDQSGQLGDGDRDNDGVPDWRAFSPVRVTGIGDTEPTVTSIAAGSAHACAVRADGSILCWGDDSSGQIGDGDEFGDGIGDDDVISPVLVDGFGPLQIRASSVSCGRSHSCALLSDGRVMCWGADGAGQLGDGDAGDDGVGDPISFSPVLVEGLSSRVLALSSGIDYNCALLDTGNVECWGWGQSGQMGDGVSTHQTVFRPESRANLSGSATSLSSGGYHSCAVLTDGSVECWGRDTHGQLGNGDDGQANGYTPVQVQGLPVPAVSVHASWPDSSSRSWTCALLVTGDVQCWGTDIRGQLGDGDQGGDGQSDPDSMAPTTFVQL